MASDEPVVPEGIDDDGTARALGWWAPLPAILAGVVPVLVLWTDNVADVPVSDGLALAAVLGLSGAGLWALLRFVVHLPATTATFTATASMLAFSWVGTLGTGPTWQLVSLAILAVGALAVSSGLAPSTTRRLDVLALATLAALLVANAVTIALGQPESVDGSPRLGDVEIASGATTGDGTLPDVWIIVPDRYPNAETLAGRGIDGTAFTDSLRERGFDVLEDATANYPETVMSLGSAWNLQLFDADGVDGDVIKRLAVPAIDTHQVGELLTDAGYVYTHIGPWSDFTAAPAIADEVLTLEKNSELAEAWTTRSALSPALQLAGLTFDADGRHRRHAEHGLSVLDQLADHDAAQPQLVMAHLILPHEPYVFGPDGGPPRSSDEWTAYDDQRRYLDTRLLAIIDRLLDRDEPPLIVLAADEGLYPEDWNYLEGGSYDWSAIDATQARDKLSILAAVRDPDGDAPDNPITLGPDSSLVNLMRWTVNEAVSSGLDRLPDDHYIYTTTGWGRLGEVNLEPTGS